MAGNAMQTEKNKIFSKSETGGRTCVRACRARSSGNARGKDREGERKETHKERDLETRDTTADCVDFCKCNISYTHVSPPLKRFFFLSLLLRSLFSWSLPWSGKRLSRRDVRGRQCLVSTPRMTTMTTTSGRLFKQKNGRVETATVV